MSARMFASGNLSLRQGTHPCWVRTSDTCHCGANFHDVSIRSITTCIHVKGGKEATSLCVRNDGEWENTHTTSSACALLTSSSALGGCRWLASSRRVSTMRQASRKQAAVAFKNKAPFARERACVRRGVTYSETYGVSG